MKSKEEILKEYSIALTRGQYDIEYDKAHLAMDKYSEQIAKDFATWIFQEGHTDITQGNIHSDGSIEDLYNLYKQTLK